MAKDVFKDGFFQFPVKLDLSDPATREALKGPKGDKGDKGDKPTHGELMSVVGQYAREIASSLKGPKGDTPSPDVIKALIREVVRGMPELQGPPGETIRGEQGIKGDKGDSPSDAHIKDLIREVMRGM